MKTSLKPILILATFLVILFSSCKKEDSPSSSNGTGTITCTIDGVSTTFNVNAQALRTDVSGAYSVQIIGAQNTGNSNQIAIGVSDYSSITAGTYSEEGSTDKVASVNYMQSGNNFPYVNDASPTNPSTVIITAISATSVQGTFKGDVYLTSNSGITTTKKVITNGQFNVKF